MTAKPRCFVLFELTPATLPLLRLAAKVYDEVWFVLCDKRVRDRHYDTVKRLGARQISDKSMHGHAQRAEFDDNGVGGGGRIARQHPRLRAGMEAYLDIEGGGEFLDQAFSTVFDEELFAGGALHRFFERESGRFGRVDVFALVPAECSRCDRPVPTQVRWFRFHRPLQWMARAPLRLAALGFLLAFPFLSLFLLWRKGVTPGKTSLAPWNEKPFLFMHRETDIGMGGAGAMHCLNNGALLWDECLHMPMQTSGRFTVGKVAFLKDRGGKTVTLADVGCPPGWAIRRVLLDYWRCLAPGLLEFAMSPYLTVGALRQIAEFLHTIHPAELIVENFGGRVIYFETENSPLARIVGMLARKKGLRTASSLHGGGGQNFPGESRARLMFDVLFTYGAAVETLKKYSPRVGAFKPIGAWEIGSETPLTTEVLPPWLRAARDRYRVIAMLTSFYVPLTQEELEFRRALPFDNLWIYFDEGENRDFCHRFLADFFRWVAETPDVVLLWKIKRGKSHMEHEHRWVKPLLENLPKDRIILLDERFAPAQVVRAADVAVASGASTVFMVGMLSGVPTVMLDGSYGGWTRRYHPLLAAESGGELAACLDALFKTPLPREVFRKVGADWDVVDQTEDTPWIRMRRALLGLAHGMARPSDFPEQNSDRKSVHA